MYSLTFFDRFPFFITIAEWLGAICAISLTILFAFLLQYLILKMIIVICRLFKSIIRSDQ